MRSAPGAPLYAPAFLHAARSYHRAPAGTGTERQRWRVYGRKQEQAWRAGAARRRLPPHASPHSACFCSSTASPTSILLMVDAPLLRSCAALTVLSSPPPHGLCARHSSSLHFLSALPSTPPTTSAKFSVTLNTQPALHGWACLTLLSVWTDMGMNITHRARCCHVILLATNNIILAKHDI